MNLKTEIRPELWDAIAQHYESGDYSTAVLDAFYYLRDVLRDSANVDGDGQALVGQALGGNLPRIRINKFETESEKDEQRGIEQVLRGMYQGIRNPRTHDKIDDKKETADAIVAFIDYTIGAIRKAKGQFLLDEWLARVYDPYFVGSDDYAGLLVAEVPPKRCLEALVAIYRRKAEGDGDNLTLVFSKLVERVGDDRLDELLSVVSEEMRTTQDEPTIRRTLQILPPRLWPRVNQVARLRIENKLIRSIGSGKASSSTRVALGGALGTWAQSYVPNFALKDELCQELMQKLNGAEEDRNYVALYFWSVLQYIFNQPTKDWAREKWITAICTAASDAAQSPILRERLASTFCSFPEAWRTQIMERLKPLGETDPSYYESLVEKDGEEIPF